MKCISCTHPVSIDLTFAFQNNQCPRCGLELMEEEVKPLFIEMKHYVDQGNDLGDLAKFLYHKFGDIDLETNHVEIGEPTFDSDLELLGPAAPKPKSRPIKPVSLHTSAVGPKPAPRLSKERLAHFNKQGNIDKMNLLVEEIQGKKENQEFLQIQDVEEDLGNWTNSDPLTPEEIAFAANEIYNMEESPDPNEMKHLSRLEGKRR